MSVTITVQQPYCLENKDDFYFDTDANSVVKQVQRTVVAVRAIRTVDRRRSLVTAGKWFW